MSDLNHQSIGWWNLVCSTWTSRVKPIFSSYLSSQIYLNDLEFLCSYPRLITAEITLIKLQNMSRNVLRVLCTGYCWVFVSCHLYFALCHFLTLNLDDSLQGAGCVFTRLLVQHGLGQRLHLRHVTEIRAGDRDMDTAWEQTTPHLHAQQGADTSFRGITDGFEVMPPLQSEDYPAPGEWHQLTSQEAKTWSKTNTNT